MRRFHPTNLQIIQLEERIVPAVIYPIQKGADFSPDSILVRFQSAQEADAAASTPTPRPASASLSTEVASILLPGLRTVSFDPAASSVEEMMEWAAGLPGVEFVEPEYRIQIAVTPNDPSYSQQYGLHNTGQTIEDVAGIPDADVDAPEAWDFNTGSGNLVVAVIDTGVDYTHPDLAANMWTNQGETAGDGIDNDGNGYVDDFRGWDFVSGSINPMDDNGHGTNVAGIIGAVGNNATGVTGVNWHIKMMALKCFSAFGSSNNSIVIEGLNYAVMMGARISNNSYAGLAFSQSFVAALANAREEGHLFVAAAGNSAANTDIYRIYPASYDVDNVVAVAATTNRDQLAGFSNYGATTVDIAAPGSGIFTTNKSTSLLGSYVYESGTSMAAPFVVGAAALIWDLYPQLSHQEVTAKLYCTVDHIPALNGKVASNGRLNIFKAISNDAPVANPDSYDMPEHTTLTVSAAQGLLANDTDPQNDPLTAQLVSGPAQGTLTLHEDGSFIYTPPVEFYGTVTFTYRVKDLTHFSGQATVSIHVVHTNIPPVTQNDGIYLARPGVPLSITSPGILANDIDPDAYPNPMTAVLSSTVSQGSIFLLSNGSFTYYPTNTSSGIDTFTYLAYDGETYSQPTTVSFRINSPARVVGASLLTRQGSSVVGNLLDLADDFDDDPLVALIVAQPAHGTVDLDSSSGLYTYHPAPAFIGLDTFTYRVHDGWEYSESATITMRVDSLPVAMPDQYTLPQNSFLNLLAPGILSNDTDADWPAFSDVLSVSLVSMPAHGTLTFSPNGYIRYTPNTGFTGIDSFTYRISDGLYTGNTTSVTFTVNPIPLALPDSYSTSNGTLNVLAATGVLVNDSTPRQTSLSARLVAGAAHGSVILNADGSFSYLALNGYTGVDAFAYVTNDGVYDSLPATVTLTLIPANHPPVANPDTLIAAINKPLELATPGILANDTDPENSQLAASIVSGPLHGTLSLQADGRLTYTPDAHFVGMDQFVYRVSDGSLASNNATVTINVKPVPLASDDAFSLIGSLTVASAYGILINDSSPNSTPLTPRLIAGPAHGTLTLHADGSFTYIPVDGYIGADGFVYVVNDGFFNSQPATVTLTVLSANQPPVAVNDTFLISADSPLAVSAPGLLANDTDPENRPLTAVLVSGPAHGSLQFAGNGSFHYIPSPGFRGIDTFTYRADDGDILSGTATVTITVTTPVLNPQRRIILGQEQGGELKVLAGETGEVVFAIKPYPGFAGAIRVATGDLTGDGIPDIVTAPGANSKPLPVRVFSGVDGQQLNMGTAFNAPFGTNYRSGIQVAVGDVNADGRADLVLGADAAPAAGLGHVRTINGLTGGFFTTWLGNFKPYTGSSFGGVRVAIGDVVGDGRREIITATAAGTPTVRIFNTAAVSAAKGLLRSFNAYSAAVTGGVFLTTANLQGDDKEEIITGAASNKNGHVRIFNGTTGTLLRSLAIAGATSGPARVAAGDVNGDGKLDLIVGISTPGSVSRARVYDALTLSEMLGTSYFYGGNYSGRLFVGA